MYPPHTHTQNPAVSYWKTFKVVQTVPISPPALWLPVLQAKLLLLLLLLFSSSWPSFQPLQLWTLPSLLCCHPAFSQPVKHTKRENTATQPAGNLNSLYFIITLHFCYTSCLPSYFYNFVSFCEGREPENLWHFGCSCGRKWGEEK